ncbi:hypothetical protein [Flavobacterium sp. PL002]|uniref:hypothetical protein n=1 Tax=Flavobacterium sp. PL002 TaxID=1897058 RepID=UPI001787CCB5|nr:hypothetical protein [Flavobacterium sp. PL002]MBE0390531.1 hypothetical protein [Flavobacterium sp. PL002]
MQIENTLYPSFKSLITNTLIPKRIKISLTNFNDFFQEIKNGLLTIYNTNDITTISYELLKYIIIPIFLLIVILTILSLITYRYRYEKRTILLQELNTKLDDFLTELVFSNYSKKELETKITNYKKHPLFKKNWYKELILNKIIAIKQNVNGIDPNLLLKIYKIFGFHRYSKKLILSRKWKDKLLGIYHYQILEYKIKTGYIRPYVNNHSNKYLNSNALIAMIILSNEKFELIANYKRKISKTDELKILDIIAKKKTHLPTNIIDWLYSDNSSIVILAIKLMVRYRKDFTIEQIRFLLNYNSIKVRKETLLAISLLYLIDANDYLIEYYKNITNKENKIFCLKTFAVIGNDVTTKFLCNFLEENDLDIKFQLVKTIYKLDPNYFNQENKQESKEQNILNKILLHVKNPYLN